MSVFKHVEAYVYTNMSQGATLQIQNYNFNLNNLFNLLTFIKIKLILKLNKLKLILI